MGIFDSIKETLDLSSVDMEDAVKYAQPKPKVKKVIEQEHPNIEITDEYRRIKELIDQNCPITIVTGKAGTGKTTLVSYINSSLSKQLAITAFTGVAALECGGCTLHSFFGFRFGVVEPSNIKIPWDKMVYEKLEVLIIDEISMVRADLMDGIDYYLRKAREDDRPFGGVQLVLIGDICQLPPIVTRTDKPKLRSMGYDSFYFFNSHAIRKTKFIPVCLEHIFRQKDLDFISVLNDIRSNKNVEAALQVINNRYQTAIEEEPETITLSATKDVANKKNALELSKLDSTEVEYHGIFKGKFSSNTKDDSLPAPSNLVLKVGAQLMFTKNDPQKQWVNGTLGVVTKLTPNKIYVESLGEDLEVNQASWEKIEYQYNEETDKLERVVIGSYTQFPLMLAWAITIHKSQGKTLSKIIVNTDGRSFATGQVYVALSRVRALEDIQLAKPINKSEIICSEDILRFDAILSKSSKTDTQ